MNGKRATVRVRVGLHGAVEGQAVAPRGDAEVPRIVRLLALAHRWHRLIDEGKVKDQADIARQTGLTRARVTQIMELRWLCPALQDQVVAGTAELPAERAWRQVAVPREWNRQFALTH